MHITPVTSPVQPDKFIGYHTGVDMEIFPEEFEDEVPVRAVCAGKLVLKKNATGYGGVAVEACQLEGKPVSILYGHLRLASIKKKTGDKVEAGEVIGRLGKDKSSETDGARKHLHLSIHTGPKNELKGYTQAAENLSEWLDPCRYSCCRS